VNLERILGRELLAPAAAATVVNEPVWRECRRGRRLLLRSSRSSGNISALFLLRRVEHPAAIPITLPHFRRKDLRQALNHRHL